MLITNEAVSKKYAQAFIDLYGHELSADMLDQLKAFEDFLSTRKGILLELTVSAISVEMHEQILQKIVQQYHLPAHVKRLMMVLIHHKRLVLLRSVIKNIRTLYGEKIGIADVVISSSHQLDPLRRQQLCTMAQTMSGAKAVRATFLVVPEMISGIRIKSDTFLWERSIRKLLHQVQQTMIQQVGL